MRIAGLGAGRRGAVLGGLAVVAGAGAGARARAEGAVAGAEDAARPRAPPGAVAPAPVAPEMATGPGAVPAVTVEVAPEAASTVGEEVEGASSSVAAPEAAVTEVETPPPGQLRQLEVPQAEPSPAPTPSPMPAPSGGQYAAPLDTGTGAGGQEDEGKTSILATVAVEQLDDQQLKVFEYNRRIQAQNKAPRGFPVFVRDGFDMAVFCDGYKQDADGLIYKDFDLGAGATPKDGQQVVFTYTAYNESGAKIDSSFKEGKPAVTQLGNRGMIPGFELALKGMRPGGRRRVVVVPALGPPVGPQTFFSAKQHEVFDIELLEVKDCKRVGFGFGFGSNLVCE